MGAIGFGLRPISRRLDIAVGDAIRQGAMAGIAEGLELIQPVLGKACLGGRAVGVCEDATDGFVVGLSRRAVEGGGRGGAVGDDGERGLRGHRGHLRRKQEAVEGRERLASV